MTAHTAPVEPALTSSGIRALAGLLAVVTLTLLVSELTDEKRRLLERAPPSDLASRAEATTTPASPVRVVVQSGPAQHTVERSTTTSSQAAPTVDSTDDARPPPVVPARAGTYSYAYTIDGGPTQSAALSVRRLDGAGHTRTELTWATADDASSEELVWNRGSVTTVRSGHCVWSPADTTLVLPLRTRSTWTSTTSCHNDDGSTTTVRTVSTVRGWTRVGVGGTRVATWVVTRKVDTTVTSGRATAYSQSAVTDFFAPALGLIVVESVRADVPDPGGRSHTVDAVRRLLDIHAT